ncbi:MAG: lysophospholipid acyltransferase family protein [Xenococcaceae cyanobacterium]
MIELNPQQSKLNNSEQSQNYSNSRVSSLLAKILYPLGCYVVLPFFFGKITVTGRENIPLTEPVIIAPTHRSYWDAIIVAYAVGRLASGRDLRFMTSEDHVNAPVKGWFVRNLGGFPVDTKNPGISSVRQSIKILSNQEMLVIFPEGGIYRTQTINPLKRGVARIALDVESELPGSNVKILPISIQYSQSHPSWGTDVTIKIAPPLKVADYLEDSLRQSSQKLTLALENALKKISENNPKVNLSSS